jgi:hypothetical protein
VQEVAAARTIAERCVVLVGTAHGNNLSNLIRNPELRPLVGGVMAVTLGDEMARATSGSIKVGYLLQPAAALSVLHTGWVLQMVTRLCEACSVSHHGKAQRKCEAPYGHAQTACLQNHKQARHCVPACAGTAAISTY